MVKFTILLLVAALLVIAEAGPHYPKSLKDFCARFDPKRFAAFAECTPDSIKKHRDECFSKYTPEFIGADMIAKMEEACKNPDKNKEPFEKMGDCMRSATRPSPEERTKAMECMKSKGIDMKPPQE